MARAIQLGLSIVVTFAAIRWSGFRLDILEAALMLASVVGIAVLVARAEANWLFVKAAAVSFATVLCVEALVFVEMTSGPAHSRATVLPPAGSMVVVMIMFSLMLGGLAGAVAHGLRAIRQQPTRLL